MRRYLCFAVLLLSVSFLRAGDLKQIQKHQWTLAIAEELLQHPKQEEQYPTEEDVEEVKSSWLEWLLGKQEEEEEEEEEDSKSLWAEIEDVLWGVETDEVQSVYDWLKHSLASCSLRAWDPPHVEVESGPKSEEGARFFALRLEDEDKKNIRKLITAMSEKNVLQLLMNKSSMKKMGEQISHVHPLRSIGFMLMDPFLRKHLKNISKVGFKWDGFLEGDGDLDGWKDRMKKEGRHGNLTPYVVGFSELLNVESPIVQEYINRADYEGLIKHFL